MLDLSQITAFALASIIVILVPGSDVFLLLRISLNQGVRTGLLALLGIHLGNVVQAVIMISGLGILLSRVPAALFVLKLLGALYLLYLAAQTIRSLVKNDASKDQETTEEQQKKQRPFTLGLLTNVTNPKVFIFFLAFFPQFLGTATSVPLQLALLSVIFIALAVIWELAIVLAASSLGATLNSRRFTKAIDVVCAVAFILLAVMVFLTNV